MGARNERARLNAELFGLLLPIGCDGAISVLRAYFDDSGTHHGGKWGPSQIVAVAGIMGTEPEMETLDALWKEHLDAPLCGRKPPLKRFHMYDCQNSIGEFTGWSRTETDYFCHELAETIVKSKVSGYGFSCSRSDWDALVTGDVRVCWGDAEGVCVRNCFLMGCAWAQHNTFDPEMSFVFDARPGSERENRVVFDAFQRQTAPPPELVGVSFLTSHKVRPLQVADYVAWEFYQHSVQVLKSGIVAPPERREWNQLTARMPFTGQIARREAIEKVVEMAKANPRLAEMVDHFLTFDPLAL